MISIDESKPQTSLLYGKKSCNKFPIAAIPRIGPPIDIGKCSMSAFIYFNQLKLISIIFIIYHLKKDVTLKVKNKGEKCSDNLE